MAVDEVDNEEDDGEDEMVVEIVQAT